MKRQYNSAPDGRVCCECKTFKLYAEFGLDPKNKMGRDYMCKSCAKEEMRRKRAAGYKAADVSKAERCEISRRYRARHPEKIRAQWAVKAALKKGTLVRPDACNKCARSCKPDAHHEDYAKRLDVEWLCRKCHGGTWRQA